MSMALTIVPTGSGTSSRWLSHLGAYWVGVVIGSLAAFGLVLTSVALLSFAVPTRFGLAVLLSGLVLLAVLRDLGLAVPLPYASRQVPESWRRVLPIGIAALFYGVALGFGFGTVFTSSTQTVMLVSLPFVGTGMVALLPIGLFAVGKTLVLLLASGTDTEEEVLTRLLERDSFTHGQIWMRRVTTSGLSVAIWSLLLIELLGGEG
jgi:hypothetical protein